MIMDSHQHGMEEGRVNLDETNANNPNPSRTNYPKKHGNHSNYRDAYLEWETMCPRRSHITNKGGRMPPMHAWERLW
jgi:hypothetical protein